MRSPPRGPSCARPAIPWSPSTPPPSVTTSSARGRSSWPGRGPRQKNVPRKRTGPRKPRLGRGSPQRRRPAGPRRPRRPRRPVGVRSTASNRPHRDAAGGVAADAMIAALGRDRPGRRGRGRLGGRGDGRRDRAGAGPRGARARRRAAGRGPPGSTADRDAAVEAAGREDARRAAALRRFPRWLVASALDTLVADASASLAELSGGQFELTHADGRVPRRRPHRRRRPPAGEDALGRGDVPGEPRAGAGAVVAAPGLAAHGAARLESIFLDEGFGTLDETNLERSRAPWRTSLRAATAWSAW